ncbi:unnamed protein product [Protopolystoma xenopodis]|uniref:Isopropylmalate dehydrogenase-like domain-containing protein n=1 Tax=Protopolystoma xenopodis TaxID=117903 RepID=A0A448XM78_9PLAT|nr:unnamed protein product [Protopolystoma xenopodis]
MVIREALSLSTFVQRCYSFPGVTTRHDNIDIVIIRENTEGEYSRLEHENVPGVVESLKIITAKKSRKVAQFAFEYAVKHKRRLVTAVHKANIMKLSDGLFLNVCSEVAKSFPQIEFNSMIIDNCCMQLVSRPHQFDMMVLPNLYGNIVGNVAAGLVGGPGLACGMNLGDKHALFETGTRNSGRSLVGKNVANPFAILLTNADMLGYLVHIFCVYAHYGENSWAGSGFRGSCFHKQTNKLAYDRSLDVDTKTKMLWPSPFGVYKLSPQLDRIVRTT